MTHNDNFLQETRKDMIRNTGIFFFAVFVFVVMVGLAVKHIYGPKDWSPELVEKIEEACIKTDPPKSCGCMMKRLTRDFSEKEFMRFAARNMDDALAIINYHILKCESEKP